jgi:hypothetical protein
MQDTKAAHTRPFFIPQGNASMALSTIQKIGRLGSDGDLWHSVVHGPARGPGSVVTTEGGDIPTAASSIADLQEASNASIVAVHESATTVMASVGYAVPVPYVAGLAMATATQTVAFNGQTYAPAFASLPFVTSGAFEAGKFRLIQGLIASDLAAPTGASLAGFQQEGAGSVVRDALVKLRERHSFADKGAVGNGIADDSAAIVAACVSNRYVEGDPTHVYRIAPFKLIDVKNLTINLRGATLLIVGAAPTGASQLYGIQVLSTVALGSAANIKILNGKIQFVTGPTTRVDNNFPIYADRVVGLEIDKIEIAGSWSAGIWLQRCNEVEIHRCFVHDTMADGITLQGCGTNIKIHDNRVKNAGDDMIAVTWFTGNDPADVGLGDGIRQSRDVHIFNNILETGAQRGIFCGGILSGSVYKNKVQFTNSIGIHLARNAVDQSSPFYSAAGVNNSNASLTIHHNSVWDCALNSNTPYPQLAGIWISESNEAIDVHDNDLQRCNNASIFCGGNARIHHNTSRDPQLQAGGTVTLAQLTYKGSHIVTGNFTGNSGSNSGSITDNEMYGGPGRAIWLGAGDNIRSWKVDGNKTYAVGNVTNVSDTLTIGAPYVADTINNTEWGYNTVTDYRAASTIPGTLQLVNSGGTLARRPKKIVSGSTYASDIIIGAGASVDPRTQLVVTSTQLAITVPPNTRIYFDVAVPGAQLYAKARTLAPGNVGGVFIEAEPLVTGGAVRNNLFNSTGADVTILAGNWQIFLGE